MKSLLCLLILPFCFLSDFTGADDHPFGLTSDSPCIMAGDQQDVSFLVILR